LPFVFIEISNRILDVRVAIIYDLICTFLPLRLHNAGVFYVFARALKQL
jgi:hypothetical protein